MDGWLWGCSGFVILGFVWILWSVLAMVVGFWVDVFAGFIV